ncbi:unnamed protein product, partial [Phaeothamnion confervicola]
MLDLERGSGRHGSQSKGSGMAQAHRQDQATVSQQQSMTLVKNAIRVSMSEICWMRGVFKPDSFEQRPYAGMQVHQINCADCDPATGQLVVRDEQAHRLTRWLEEGVFQALERGFLRRVELLIVAPTLPTPMTTSTGYDSCLSGDGPDDGDRGGRSRRGAVDPPGEHYDDGAGVTGRLLERYYFDVTYGTRSKDGRSGKLEPTLRGIDGKPLCKDNMKSQITRLIRQLMAFGNTLDELPKRHFLTMKLFYYDNVTPPDYEPPNFCAADPAALRLGPDTEYPLRIKVGDLATPHCLLSLKFEGRDPMYESDMRAEAQAAAAGAAADANTAAAECCDGAGSDGPVVGGGGDDDHGGALQSRAENRRRDGASPSVLPDFEGLS